MKAMLCSFHHCQKIWRILIRTEQKKKELNTNTVAQVFAILWLVVATVKGNIVLTGCSNAFILIKCPMDDTVVVKDARITTPQNGSPCIMKPPDTVFWKVPKAFHDFCLANKTCVFSENICEGKNQCAFYADPHLIGNEEIPTLNSELIIGYECKAGNTRKAGLAILIIVALALTGGGAYLIFTVIKKKTSEPASSYASFNNERGTPSARASAGTAQPAQVQLSVSGSTNVGSVPSAQADVTPSSGSVF